MTNPVLMLVDDSPAGDIRTGSVKRVASAVGEGSIAATQMNQYLEEQGRRSDARE